MATDLPPELARLPELARNLWWSWHPEAAALFDAVRGSFPEPNHHNPVLNLYTASRETLLACARDAAFVARLRRVLADFDADTRDAPTGLDSPSPSLPGPVAYFCAEFGVHSSLPQYSGGLGILAGDVAKEASDLGLPLIGVGFMYPQGYFRQHVSAEGRQEELYARVDRLLAPVEPACAEPGRPCAVTIDLPDRLLHVAVWLVRVGRSRLYLMDTDVEENSPWDREITNRLYGGDREARLRQEIVLGVCGVRLLRRLGVAPALWHVNEGHATFLLIERLRELVAAGRGFEDAVAEVRAGSVFTSHTPVPAGNDSFPFPMVEKYLSSYWDPRPLERARVLALGAHAGAGGQEFNMTALGLRLAGRASGVSRRHGEVARHMWRGLWPGRREADVPIVSVTNGVHLPTWIGAEMALLFRAHLGEDWVRRQDDPDLWRAVDAIPDRALWDAHHALKLRLVRFLHDRARRRWTHEKTAPSQIVSAGALLDPEALTLGFARRFATYKRADLLLADPARLRALLTDARRPAQIVFAGKAHPADEPAKQVLGRVYRAATDAAFGGRIAFVEDYDMHVATHLVQGVDAWLNVPRAPLEACGTSGQKAAMNGVPSVSVLDGWWAEAYDGTNGWAVGGDGGALAPADDRERDAADAEALYRVLESEVVPAYYERGPDGLPARWLAVMRRAIRTLAPAFCARRMLKEYIRILYAPDAGGAVDPPAGGA